MNAPQIRPSHLGRAAVDTFHPAIHRQDTLRKRMEKMARKEGHAPPKSPKQKTSAAAFPCSHCGMPTRAKYAVCKACEHTAECQCPRCDRSRTLQAEIDAALPKALAGGARLSTAELTAALATLGIHSRPQVVMRKTTLPLRNRKVSGNVRRTRIWWLA